MVRSLPLSPEISVFVERSFCFKPDISFYVMNLKIRRKKTCSQFISCCKFWHTLSNNWMSFSLWDLSSKLHFLSELIFVVNFGVLSLMASIFFVFTLQFDQQRSPLGIFREMWNLHSRYKSFSLLLRKLNFFSLVGMTNLATYMEQNGTCFFVLYSFCFISFQHEMNWRLQSSLMMNMWYGLSLNWWKIENFSSGWDNKMGRWRHWRRIESYRIRFGFHIYTYNCTVQFESSS